jgi:DNA topoisomerase IA
LILQSKPIIEIIVERNKSIVNNKENENFQIKIDINKSEETSEKKETKNSGRKKLIEDEEGLVILLEQRLQFILRSLTKLCIMKTAGNQKKE